MTQKDNATTTGNTKDNATNNNGNVKKTETLENGKKKITLNAEKFKDKHYELTQRSTLEETADKPRTIHKPRHEFNAKRKHESPGYYGIRKLAFTLTQKEYRTPQNNLILISDFLKKKGIKLSDNLGIYSARDFGLKLYPSNANSNEYILIRVSTGKDDVIEYTEKQILDKFKQYAK